MKRLWLRWMPAVAVPAVIAGAVLIAPLQAGATTDLPDKTPAEVMAMVARNEVRALSGTLEQSANLGLPQLPSAPPTSGGSASSGLDVTAILELFTAPHSARIYTDGTGNARLQVMDRMAERDFVRNGSEVWFYNSRDNTATHLTLPPRTGSKLPTHDPGATPGTMPTPEELANRLLASADPTTSVALGEDARIAGRGAYTLVLTPKSGETTLESAVVYVDGDTGVPLGVEVRARGQQDPAFRVAFSQLTLGAPDASLFQFTPPAGATVEEVPLPPKPAPGTPGAVPPQPPSPVPDAPKPAPVPEPPAPESPAPQGSVPENPVPAPGTTPPGPRVTGNGWDAVVELPGTALQQALDSTPLLAQLAQPVSGGRLFSTSLVNVLLTDDGRVFAGMVTSDRLLSVAANR